MAFTVTWLGQGGFLVRAGQRTLAIDPYLTDDIFKRTGANRRQRPIPIRPEELRCDLMIATHDHDDHLDPATVPGTRCAAYAGPDSCLSHYRALGITAEKLTPFNRGDILHLDDMRLMAVPAIHTEDSIGLILQYEGVCAYFTGDSLYDESLLMIDALDVDVIFPCINGRLGNMNLQEAATLSKALHCRAAIPHHYDMFAENSADPKAFAKALESSNIEVIIPPFHEATDLIRLMAEVRAR